MIVDAQSLICFLKDIIELYCNEKYEGVPYPTEMTSYIEQLEKDLAYEAGSKAQKRDIEYFQKEIEKSEPIYSGIHGRDKLEAAREMFKNPELRSAFNASDDTKSALDIFHLEEEPTKRLMDFCEKYHVSPGVPSSHGTAYIFPEDEWIRGCFHQQRHRETRYFEGEKNAAVQESIPSDPNDFPGGYEVYRRRIRDQGQAE